MLQGLKRNWVGVAFGLALLFAAGLAVLAGKTFRLDNTRLLLSSPVDFSSGWVYSTATGKAVLTGPSRTEVQAHGVPFVISHVLPGSIDSDTCIAIETKNEQVTAAIDGVPVYSYGAHDVTAFGWEFGAVWQLIPIPQDTAGKTLTLTLEPQRGRTGEAPYPVLYGCRSTVLMHLFFQNSWVAVACTLMFVIALVYAISAVLHFIRCDGRGEGMLYFALFVFLCAVWGTTDALLLQFVHGTKSISYLLFACSFYLLPVPFALFMGATTPEHRTLFRRSAAAGIVYFFVRITLYLMGVLDFETWLFLVHLYMGYLIIVSLLPFFRDPRTALKNPFGPLSLIVLVIGEAAALICFYANDMLDVQRASYASGFYVGVFLYALVVTIGVFRKNSLLFRRAVQAEYFERRAYTDELTGLLSSRGFDDTVPQMVQTYPDRQYYIVDFDVNFFEQYNAVNGFAAGNELLLRIRDSLHTMLRAGELSARLEADHFVLLLYGESLPSVIERITATDERFRCQTMPGRILLSYGVVDLSDTEATVTVLRNRAAMAKRTVKGNYNAIVAVYDRAFHERQLTELAVASRFDELLASGEIRPFYQPKIDVQTGRIVGAEALVRRILPDGTVVQPSELVPPLEGCGLISKLDAYVFDCVCLFLSERIAAQKPCVPISVNFSRAHLFETAFAERLSAVCAAHGVPVNLFVIELTESMFLVNKTLLDSVIQSLHAYGFAVSIDDFGSGYSSLNMLASVQVDEVKIDKSFLDSFDDDKRNRIVLNNILRLCWDLNIPTVAEGVEAIRQLAFLQEHRCTIAQGYYFSKPIPESEFAAKYLSV